MRAMSRTSAGVGTSSWQQRRLVLSVAGLVFAAASFVMLHGITRLQAVPGRSNDAAHAPSASQHAMRPGTVTEHGRAAAPKIQKVTITPSIPLPEFICCCPLAMSVSCMFHAAQSVLGAQQAIKSQFIAIKPRTRCKPVPGTLGREWLYSHRLCCCASMQLHVCPCMCVGAGNEPLGDAVGLESWPPTSTIKGVTALGNVWAIIPCSAEGVAIAGSGRGCGAASATGACAAEAVATERVAAEGATAEEVQIQQSGAMGHPGVGPLRRPILRHVPGRQGPAHCFGPPCLWES